MEIVLSYDVETSTEKWEEALVSFCKENNNKYSFMDRYSLETKRKFAEHMIKYIQMTQNRKSGLEWSSHLIAHALKAIRLVMREPIGTNCLQTKSCLFLFILMATRESSSHEICREAVGCIMNAVCQDPTAQKLFLDINGPLSVLNVLRVPRTAAAYRVACRILLHMSVQFDSARLKLKKEGNILVVLVTTLVSILRRKPAFPIGTDRLELAIEVLKLLYALADASDKEETEEEKAVRTELGICLRDILGMPLTCDRIGQLKVHVCNLLMYIPRDYPFFLVKHGAVPHIVQILEWQLRKFAGDRTIDPTPDVIGPLNLLDNLSKAVPAAKLMIKDAIFGTKELPPQEQSDDNSKRNMHAFDAELGTSRSYLFEQLTSVHMGVKHYVGELLFNLCDSQGEFIRRVGFGNAIGYLHAKGLFKVGGL